MFNSAPWLHPTHQADGGPTDGLITRFLFSPLTDTVSFWSLSPPHPHLEVCQNADGLHVFGATVAEKSICYCSPSRFFNIMIKTSVFCVSKVLLNCTVARLAVGLQGWRCWSVGPPLQPKVKSIGWIKGEFWCKCFVVHRMNCVVFFFFFSQSTSSRLE